MRNTVLILLMAATVAAASAQTAAKPAPHAAAKPAATASKSPAASSGVTVPPGVPPGTGPVKTAFSLHYQDLKVGTGADAEPGRTYKVHYTGYLGANGRPDDGHKFDSSYDHRAPAMDKDGKPVLGDDGQPKLGDPQPFSFPQGYGRLIPGFDQGLAGMKVGGKRRIFIPWQMAYGAKGRPGPDAAHPGIPPKADLIFDVELLDVSQMDMGPSHPYVPALNGGRPTSGTTPPAGTATPAQPATPPQPK
jgi:peptidylprolyl isomerase